MLQLPRAFYATALALVFGGFSVAYFGVGSRLTAAAPRNVGAPPAHLNAESVEIPSASGSRLAAWLVLPENPAALVVLLHGIRGSRHDMLPRAELLRGEGYGVLLLDLQAHGESKGEHITFGHLESRDALAAVAFLRTRFPELPVGGIGVSLGGASFALAGVKLDLDALVLESVYPTLEEAVFNRIALRLGPLAHVLSPLLLAQLQPRLGLAPSDLRPQEAIAELRCPLLIASGSLDRHTTAAETQRLFNSARNPKKLWILEGAGHVDLLRFAPEAYRAQVLSFLDDHLRPETSPHLPIPPSPGS